MSPGIRKNATANNMGNLIFLNTIDALHYACSIRLVYMSYVT
ncbi:protein of unknown function [Candidatus Nitrosocosmicus franklandus]|uniref:Uncharacterized protein n=1 Tax=Candidatus Nitrosocosmicus franklandianus TaxID=1798806 RepID=A0A484IBX1_9ARCH|nr:protein of unknown function [Candidatus Nitrosocosmicus franklandus]